MLTQSLFYTLDAAVAVKQLGVLGESSGLWAALKHNVNRVRAVRKALRTFRPDVMVSFGDTVNVVATLAAMGTGIPVVISERTDPAHEDIGKIWSALRRVVYPQADSLVVQTPEAAGFFDSWNLNVHVVPNPVSVPADSGESITVPKPALIAVGRLDVEKNYPLILEAFSQAVDNIPGWNLVIAGDGPMAEELHLLAESLGLEGRVHFLGQVSNIGGLLAQADCFVLGSTFEGFPNALCEAMASGLACISTDCPSGPRNIVSHGEDGVLVPNRDIAAMVESMALIMDDSELRQRMGAKAARLKETLGTDHVMYLWEQCLDKVRGVEMADAEHHDVPLDERFAFGKNWADFLKKLTPERIEAAKKFFRESFPEGLEGKAFLDIGCGSGLFSLCAKELGAKVMSFDFDPDSVACTKDLKARFYAGDEDWDIFEGSVLDDGMMDKLGTFDVVYTWGGSASHGRDVACH